MKDRELKDKEVKIKRKIEELFFLSQLFYLKMIWISLKNKMKKLRPIKNTAYDWLINHFLESIRKNVDGSKDKILSHFR